MVGDEETWTRRFMWKAFRMMVGVGIQHSGAMPDSFFSPDVSATISSVKPCLELFPLFTLSLSLNFPRPILSWDTSLLPLVDFLYSDQQPLPHLPLSPQLPNGPRPPLAKRPSPLALAWWLSWLGHHPIHQKVMGSIPGQGTCPSCRFNAWSGRV